MRYFLYRLSLWVSFTLKENVMNPIASLQICKDTHVNNVRPLNATSIV